MFSPVEIHRNVRLSWYNCLGNRNVPHRSIKENKKRIASEMFREGKISFLEICEMVEATPSKMIGILIKNGAKIGSELIPLDIGLNNLRECWK